MLFCTQFCTDNVYVFVLSALAALVFGVVYAVAIHKLKQSGRDRGYMSIMVVFGVLAVLLASVPILGLTPFLVLLGLFALAGIPMIIEDWYSGTSERSRAIRALTAELEASNARMDDIATIRRMLERQDA